MHSTKPKLPTITEKQFQAHVVQYAKLMGWWVYHTYNSQRSEPGFPDLVLIRAPRLIYAELKTEKGKLSLPQELVITRLRGCNVDVRVWRPSDWNEIERVLR